MATLTAVPASKIRGGSFLIEERTPEEVFTPEDFSEQHQLIAQTAEEFANKEIVPNIEKMEHKDFAVIRELVRKAGELGLSGVDVPEQYGGMEMDKVTSVDHRRSHREVWGIQHDLGSAHLHWHASHRVLRHGRAEEEVSAGSGERRDGWGLCAFRIVLRFRRAELPHPGASSRPTASTTS